MLLGQQEDDRLFLFFGHGSCLASATMAKTKKVQINDLP